jgi:hypothetical protein
MCRAKYFHHPKRDIGDPSLDLRKQKQTGIDTSTHSNNSRASKPNMASIKGKQKQTGIGTSTHSNKGRASTPNMAPVQGTHSATETAHNSNKPTRSRPNIVSLTLSSAKFAAALERKNAVTASHGESTSIPDPASNAAISANEVQQANEQHTPVPIPFDEHEQSPTTENTTRAVDRGIEEKIEKFVIDPTRSLRTNHSSAPIETLDSVNSLCSQSSHDALSTKRPVNTKKNLVMLGKKHLTRQTSVKNETDTHSAETPPENLDPTTSSTLLQKTNDLTLDTQLDKEKKSMDKQNKSEMKNLKLEKEHKGITSLNEEKSKNTTDTLSTSPQITRSSKDKTTRQRKESMTRQSVQHRSVGSTSVSHSETDLSNTHDKQSNAVDPDGIYYHKATPRIKSIIDSSRELARAPRMVESDAELRNHKNHVQQSFDKTIQTGRSKSAQRPTKMKATPGDSPKFYNVDPFISEQILDQHYAKGKSVENYNDVIEPRAMTIQLKKTNGESRPHSLISPRHLHPAIASKKTENVEPTSPNSFAGRAGAFLKGRRMQEEDMLLESNLQNLREPQSPMTGSYSYKAFQYDAFQEFVEYVANNRASNYTPSNPLTPSSRHVTSNTLNNAKTKGTSQPRLSKRYNRSSRFMDNDLSSTAFASAVFAARPATVDATSDVILNSGSVVSAESSFVSLDSASTDSDIRLPAASEVNIDTKTKGSAINFLKTAPSLVSKQFMQENTENVEHIHSVCKNVTVTDLANDLVGEVNQVSADLRKFATGFNDRMIAFRECVANTNADSLYPKCKDLVPFDMEDVAIEVEYLDEDEADFVDDPDDDFGMCTSHVDRTVYQVDDAIRPSLACVNNS